MKILLLLIASLCAGQVLTPSFSQPFAYIGTPINMVVTFADQLPTAGIAGLQFTVSPTNLILGTPTLGPAAIAAGKTITTCNPASSTCLSVGANTNTIGSGVVMTIPVTFPSGTNPGVIPVSLTGLVASSATGTAIPLTTGAAVLLNVGLPTGTTTWFSATAGDTTCRVSKVAQSPIRVSYVCFHTYGARAGSFTVDAVNGGNGTSYFNLDLHSIAGPVIPQAPNSNVSCLIQVNGTSAAVMMIGGLQIPAFSATYSCQGYTTIGGSSMVSWP